MEKGEAEVLLKNSMWPVITLAGMVALPALSAEQALGPRGTDSTFYISRSENRNQVHYGVRVGEDCRPVGTSPAYVYWRMLEKGPSETEPLLGVEGPVYGLEDAQEVVSGPEGWRVRVKLRSFPDRQIEIAVSQENGVCTTRAWTKVGSSVSQLNYIYVKTHWPFGIDYVRISGVGADGQVTNELVRR